MSVRWMGLLMLAAVLCAMPVSAQEDSPVFNLSLTFLTTPEVSIKLKAPNLGRPVRGKLIVLSDGEVIVDTGVLSRRDRERGERGQRVPFSRMESLRSSDGRFEFTPDEGFKVIAQRVIDTYPSIRVEGNVEALEFDRPPRAKSKNKKDDDDESELMRLQDAAAAEDEESNPSASGNKTAPKKQMGIGNKGIGGLKSLPKANKSAQEQKEEEEESTEPVEESSPQNDKTGLADTTEEHYCSNCKKLLSRSALRKEECPHCGTTFVMPKASSSSPSGQGAFAASGTPSSPEGGAFAPMGTTPTGQGAAVAAPAASNTVVVQGGGGFSFEQVPTWAKGGIFVLVILVGYHVLFNR